MKFEIIILKDEYFFGGAIEEAIKMPYKEGFKSDLREHFYSNQCSPTLLSTKGRIIRSEEPFYYEFLKDSIVFECSSEVKVLEVGTCLKDAYDYFRSHYFEKYDGILSDLMLTAPQYDTWISMEYAPSQEKVLKYAHEIIDRGFTPGVMIIDDSWALDYGVFEWNRALFPDPKKMVDELHQLGFKVLLWETPYISPDTANFRKAREEKIITFDNDGKPVLAEWWNGFSGVLDLSNPGGREWLIKQNEYMMREYGIDGFKMDAADPHLYPNTCKFYDGSHKAYQSKYYADVALNYDLCELRACYKSEGAPISQRMVDKNQSWTDCGIDRLVPDAIAMSLMGYFYFAPDMVGGGMIIDFWNKNYAYDQEYFVRYAQIATFLPMIQYSLAPWRILNEENYKIIDGLKDLRQKLVPYIIEQKRKAETLKEPIIKSLEYAYPNSGYEKEMSEFLLGDDILVAPIIVQGQTKRIVVVPDGTWYDEDGKEYQKGTYEIFAPLNKIIYLLKDKNLLK